MKKLKFTLESDSIHLYGLILLVLSLTLNNLVLIPLLIYFIIIIRRSVNSLYFILIITLFLAGYWYSINPPKYIDGEGIIIKKEVLEYNTRYQVNINFRNYEIISKNEFNTGDIILIKASVNEFKNATIPGGFNERSYHLSKNRIANLQVDNLTYKKTINLLKIRDIDHILTRFFKDVDIIEIDSVAFLFSLSSMHLMILIGIIIKVFYYLDVKNKEKYLLLFIILSISYFVGDSVILLRFSFIYLFKYLNEQFGFTFTKLDIEAFSFILILLFIPLSIYSITFSIMYLIVFFNNLRVYKSSSSFGLLILTILLPYQIMMNKEGDLILMLMIPILMLGIKFIFVPSILLITILPFVKIFNYLESFYNTIMLYLNQYRFKFYLPNLDGIALILYFVFLMYVFSSNSKKQFNKRLVMYFLLLTIGIFYTFKPKINQVIFLDVGQGDSAVIFKNGKVIVSDAYQYVGNYLKTEFVYTIDYLIISHADLDHFKEASDLINEFRVETVILSDYQDYNITHSNIVYIGENNLMELDDIGLRFLSPLKNYHNKNLNSASFIIEVDDLKYFFAGDLENISENDVSNEYKYLLKSDIIKVPHHGSNTSSTINLLKYVNPKIGIISVKEQNIYNLPDLEVIERYKSLDIKLYLTSVNGSVLIKHNQIFTYPP